MRKPKVIPRGIRNNNPLNIRIGNVWLGERANPDDPQFEQFVSMKYGIRAAFVLMRRYILHYHRDTLPAIITAWAPPTENNTTAYIDRVAQISGLEPDARLNYYNQEQMCKLLDAMIIVECGQRIPMEAIVTAYHLT